LYKASAKPSGTPQAILPDSSLSIQIKRLITILAFSNSISAILDTIYPKAIIAFQQTSSLTCKKAPIRGLTILVGGNLLREFKALLISSFSRIFQTSFFK